MEQLFDEHLFLQNAFHLMLLTFGCWFYIGKGKTKYFTAVGNYTFKVNKRNTRTR